MVLMEAMACGLPVVATDVGGISEVVKHQETGLLVQPGNPGQLAVAVAQLAAQSDLAALYGNQARKIILERYSLKAAAENYARLYNQILIQ